MVTGSQFSIVFVVVTYNAADYINQCIESIEIKFGAGYTHSWRVIVIDNASSDNTLELLGLLEQKNDWLEVTSLDKNIGFGSANNVGFTSLNGDYYVLLNQDAYLLADSISPVVDLMKKYKDIAVCGLPLVFPDGSPQTYAYAFSSWQRWLLHLLGVRSIVSRLAKIKLFAYYLEKLPSGKTFIRSQSSAKLSLDQTIHDNYPNPINSFSSVDWVCGAAMVLAGDFIRNIGGFDSEIFLYGEDEDLCIVAHSAGRRVMVAEVPPIVHVLGWGENRFNKHIAVFKYQSLKYFITKNITGRINRFFMRVLLPFHVYGFKHFYLIWKS